MEARFPDAEPSGPAGHSTFEWILGGQFLLQRTEFSVPGPPEGAMIVGLDPEGKGFVQHYFDSRGIARIYQMRLTGGVWVLQRDTPDFTPLEFRQRFVGNFSDDGGSIAGRWERSRNGTDWDHDFELHYQRMT
jgi:hypothetical protein